MALSRILVTPEAGVFALPNGEAFPLVPGRPVYNFAGFVKHADAASLTRARVVGMVLVGAGATLPTLIQTGGFLTLTTAQWDVVTGLVGGLTVGLAYFLSLTSGQIATASPTADGQSATRLGEAVSTTTLQVQLEPPVFL